MDAPTTAIVQAPAHQPHPTRQHPLCVNCRHLSITSDHRPGCNHPGMPVSTVDGLPAVAAVVMRLPTPQQWYQALLPYCGPDGQLFQTKLGHERAGADAADALAVRS